MLNSCSLGTLATHFLGGKAKLGDWGLSVVKATFSWGCGSVMIWKSRRKSHLPSCWNVTKSCAFNICAKYGKKYTHGIGCGGRRHGEKEYQSQAYIDEVKHLLLGWLFFVLHLIYYLNCRPMNHGVTNLLGVLSLSSWVFFAKLRVLSLTIFHCIPLKPTFNLTQVSIAQKWSRFINKNARCLYVFTSYPPFEGSVWNLVPVGKVHPNPCM